MQSMSPKIGTCRDAVKQWWDFPENTKLLLSHEFTCMVKAEFLNYLISLWVFICQQYTQEKTEQMCVCPITRKNSATIMNQWQDSNYSNFPQCKNSKVKKNVFVLLEKTLFCTDSHKHKKLLRPQEFSWGIVIFFYMHTDLPSMMVMTSFILIWSLSSSSKSCSALMSVGIVCRAHTQFK